MFSPQDEHINVAPILEPQSPNVRWDCIRAIPPMDNPVRGHRAPPMLDTRRTSGTLGILFDGPAANLLMGMTMGQLDDYNFLLARLSRIYDPPEREEAHRAELRARTRRQNDQCMDY